MMAPRILVLEPAGGCDPALAQGLAAGASLPLVGIRCGCVVLTNRPVQSFVHTGGPVSLVIGVANGPGLRPPGDRSWLHAPAAKNPAAAAAEIASGLHGMFAAIVWGLEGARVMGEPSGSLPLELATGPVGGLVSDHLTLEDLALVGLAPDVDWRAVATTLVAPATATHLPHLRATRPAVPGRLHRLSSSDEGERIWSPADVARRKRVASHDALREAVDHAVEDADPGSCAMQLSGGLDSSIVLASLCRATRNPPSVNLATSAAGGDERPYARLVAEALDSPLSEFAAVEPPSYRGLFDRAEAHPFTFGLDDVFERAAADAARTSGRSRLMTGQGGDAVFFQPPTPLVAVDRMRALGFGRRSLAPLADDARRMRSSIWHHLIPAIADRFRSARVPRQLTVPGLLTAAAREWVGNVAPDHPWLDDAQDLPPGKRMQITMLANSQIFYSPRPHSDGVELVHPLLSRRVLEAILPIATHELARGRNDRGLARETFADRLPRAILDRRTKGDAADHYSRAALANLPFLREALLDGVLVRQGIVDREALERTLTPEHLFYSLDYRALVIHASCEAWVSHWTG